MYFYYIPSVIVSFVAFHWINKRWLIPDIITDLCDSVWPFLFIHMSGINGPNTFAATNTLFIIPIWYFSAMLIGMLVLYPLMRRYRELFFVSVAPILFLVCYGYLCVTFGGLWSIWDWTGFLYSGVIRAVGGLCLGCVCFYGFCLSKGKKGYAPCKYFWLTTVVEVGTLALALYLFYSGNIQKDFAVAMLFALLVYLAFTRESLLNRIFDNTLFRFLGKLSISIYVSHSILFSYNYGFYPADWKKHYITYMMLVVIIGLANYTVAQWVMRKVGYRRKKN